MKIFIQGLFNARLFAAGFRYQTFCCKTIQRLPFRQKNCCHLTLYCANFCKAFWSQTAFEHILAIIIRIFSVIILNDAFFYPSDVKNHTFRLIFFCPKVFCRRFFFGKFILPSQFSLTDDSSKSFTARFFSD